MCQTGGPVASSWMSESLAAALWPGTAGNWRVNVVPSPSADDTETVAPIGARTFLQERRQSCGSERKHLPAHPLPRPQSRWSGRLTMNVAPSPLPALSATIVPPCNSTIC